MLTDGLYELMYTSQASGSTDSDCALATLRNGHILGSDRSGGVFGGRYEFDHIERRSRVRLKLQVPPDGELITGYCPGPLGSLLDIVAEFDPMDSLARTVAEIAGQPVEIRLKYIGPLPP